jgi:hypothetical protein
MLKTNRAVHARLLRPSPPPMAKWNLPALSLRCHQCGIRSRVMRLQSTGVWQREASLGFLAAITAQVQQGVFLGAEARYLRKYDALDATAFAGDALFIGPTLFVRFSKTLAISGA